MHKPIMKINQLIRSIWWYSAPDVSLLPDANIYNLISLYHAHNPLH